ncbi:MAG TPA: hypothetical protein VIY27_14770 [Myxococcota bacterium]
MTTRSETRLFLLLAYAAGAALISQSSFTAPCLNWEEGEWFVYAFEHGFWKGLVTPQYGYYAFWTSLATTLGANAAPLQFAPFVTTSFAFMLWLLLAILIVVPGSPFRTTGQQALALTVVLFTFPMYARLHTHVAHFFLGVCTVTMLLSQVPDRLHAWLYRGVLLAAGMTGVISIFLTPAFWYRWWRARAAREHLVQASILSACAVAQLVVFVFDLSVLDFVYGRSIQLAALDPIVFVTAVANKSVVATLLTPSVMEHLGPVLVSGIQTGSWPLICIGALGLCLALGLVVIGGRGRSRGDASDGTLLLMSFIIIAVLSFVGSTDASPNPRDKLFMIEGHHRYFYLPNVIVGFALILHAASPHRGRWKTWLYRGLLSWFVLSAVGGYVLYRSSQPDWVRSCPGWKGEVAAWQRGESHRLTINPPTRFIRLPAREAASRNPVRTPEKRRRRPSGEGVGE